MTRSHARTLDQFYTDRPLASTLTGVLLSHLQGRGVSAESFRFLEPSAGEGAFMDALTELSPSVEQVGCDLDPKHPSVIQQDFLTWEAPAGKPWVVFGNPPFGKNAALAIQFFNRSAGFANTIAFIVPRTFEKASVKNRLDSRFELVEEVAIAPLSFHHEGERVPVPCVFQIWERLPDGQHRAQIPTPSTHPDFRFLKLPEGSAFAFQRVGAAAGRTKALDAKNLAPPSHYFLAPRAGLSGDALRATLDAIDWTPIKERTAGNPSISKAELIEAYQQRLLEFPPNLS